MRALLLALTLLAGCRDANDTDPTPCSNPEAQEASKYLAPLTALLDPATLDSLKGKRAATPRLRKACYWLELARRDGHMAGGVIDSAHTVLGMKGTERAKAQRDSLIRNVTILERLGCLDGAGMAKLRKGNAPTITKGPYAGEIVTADHIVPRSICEELDEKLYNLEFVPLTINQRKGSKVGQRQFDLARRWNKAGLLSSEGLDAVIKAFKD